MLNPGGVLGQVLGLGGDPEVSHNTTAEACLACHVRISVPRWRLFLSPGGGELRCSVPSVEASLSSGAALRAVSL